MIASSGEKVLLVDADMRKPRIHAVFHESQEPGLSNFLKNEAGLEDIIRPSGIDNLSVVYSGRATSNSAELLGSGGMKNFIESACRMYSKIIFDTPPVSLVTDAQILSSMTTAVILVVEGGKSTRGLLTRSKDLLAAVHANVAGVVLNNIKPSGDIYSYPQYYYGKYYNISAKA
jgi:capsular exopolysaccharide synthesis family protein